MIEKIDTTKDSDDLTKNLDTELDEITNQVIPLLKVISSQHKELLLNYEKAANEIISFESQNPIKAATAMNILKERINASSVTSVFFSGVNTFIKEKSEGIDPSKVKKIITENSLRMFSLLSDTEKEVVLNISNTAKDLQDCEYYLKNYKRIAPYNSANQVVEKFKKRNGCVVTLGHWLYIYPFGYFVIKNGLDSDIFFVKASVVSIWILGLLAIIIWKNGKPYRKAKRFVAFRDFEIDYLNKLNKQFGDVEQAKFTYATLKKRIDDFFG